MYIVEKQLQIRRNNRDSIKQQKLLNNSDESEKETRLYCIDGSFFKYEKAWARLRCLQSLNPIVLDFGFADKSIREMHTAFDQLRYCMQLNRYHRQPFQLHITSVLDNEAVKDAIKSGANAMPTVYEHEEPCWEIFPKENLVYLTEDGPALQVSFDYWWAWAHIHKTS